ncbi:MAG TPA: NAD(P)-dependent oxidoreductase [Ktedonobacteraceae bacterium]
MTILITGGTGFIGSEVVRMLLKRGEQRPVVFHASGNARRLADVLEQVELITGDLANFSHVLDAVKRVRPDVIYHLGAMLSTPSDADPAAAMQTNVMGTFHVLEAARLFAVPQVLFSSSISTYALDIAGEVVDDATIQRPLQFYGATKLFGEHLGLFYKRRYSLDFRGVRYPSTVGPGVKTPGAMQYTSWMN